ncbi:MAG TPA: trifunctional transcriptional activator/DNA repair protein Ada/methylated-DNA--[protein]-cysteine S-methyltransferase [Isosphaeraceae bacterium]
MTTTLPTRGSMLRAFLDGDSKAEGIFLVAVRTTRIFCRPTCPARKPKPENVEFYPDPTSALRAGFRPCKRCRPMDAVRKPPELVERLRMMIEDDPAHRVGDKDLTARGIDPSTARRQFRRYFGMTFQAYQRSRRMGAALRDVRGGNNLLEVGLDAGYASPSAFREAFARLFGRPPRDSRDADGLFARRIETPLGATLALADDEGLRLLEFLDGPDLERKARALGETLGRAVIHADHPLLDAVAEQLDAYFAGRRLTFDVPLAPLGSPWQLAVWERLRAIPPGETRSYVQLAESLGRPTASRAVGHANGRNPIGIVVPCHRVIRADGSLCGYAGGPWRKQWLLDHERAHLGRPSSA